MKRLTATRIARWLFERDGEPDGHECGEANRATYQREAEDVIEAIKTLGFKIVPESKGR